MTTIPVTTVTALTVLAVLSLHELGHAIAILSVGARPRPVLSWHGPGLAWDGQHRSGRIRAFVTFAGPSLNLLTVVPFWHFGWHLAAMSSVELGVLCLIPTKRSDGGRALRALFSGGRDA